MGCIGLICHDQVQISHSFGLKLLGVQCTYTVWVQKCCDINSTRPGLFPPWNCTRMLAHSENNSTHRKNSRKYGICAAQIDVAIAKPASFKTLFHLWLWPARLDPLCTLQYPIVWETEHLILWPKLQVLYQWSTIVQNHQRACKLSSQVQCGVVQILH